MIQETIFVQSSMDKSLQPSLFYRSELPGKQPLLVGLHTWSFDRFNQIDNMLPYAEKNGFHLLLPEFRGNNLKTNPDCTHACGSEYARQDIKDAIDYLVEREEIDTDNIFLLGASGGGHMALMMAGFCPEYFKAIGAFVPITDLVQWIGENENYREHIAACCMNDVCEMEKRSPVCYIDKIAKANLKIFHGKFDPSVPVSHSLKLYNHIMRDYPEARVFLDIFDGGHEMNMETAMQWLLSKYKRAENAMVTG